MSLIHVEDDTQPCQFCGIQQEDGSALTLDHQKNCNTWISLLALNISWVIDDGCSLDINTLVQSILGDIDIISTSLEEETPHLALLQKLNTFLTPEILAQLPEISRIAYENFIETLDRKVLSQNNRRLCNVVRMFQNYLVGNNLVVVNALELTQSLETAILRENS